MVRCDSSFTGSTQASKAAVLLPHQHAAFARHGEGLLRLGMGPNHRASVVERERRNRIENRGGLGGLTRAGD